MSALPISPLGGQPTAAPIPQPKVCNAEVALRLAGAGLYVFPVGNDKKPLVRWRDELTCDAATTAKWWLRNPSALVGIDVGKSGLIVIDADRHPGAPDGVAALQKVIGGPMMALGCPVIKTAGNGRHLIFVPPAGETFGNSSGALPKGIDVRGLGGYVVAPGSTREDGSSWAAAPGTPDLAEAFEAGAIPPLPEKIAALIRQRPERAAAPVTEAPQAFSQPKVDAGTRERGYAARALADESAKLADYGRGERNTRLNIAALAMGEMVGAGWISELEVRSALRSACETNGYIRDKGQHPFDATFASGMRKGKDQPRKPLEDRAFANDDAKYRAIGDETALRLIEAHGGAQRDDAPQPTAADLLDGWSFDGDALPEPPPMLVKRLVPLDGITFVGGQSGAGKTFIVIDLAVSVASGEPFFGHKVTERVGVAIFAAEGASTIASRVTVARNHKAHGEILPIAWLGAVPNLADPKEVRAMVNRLRAVDARFRASHGVRLGAVICDTLSASFSLADENDNSEAAKAIRAMKNLSDALRVVVLPVHHFGKAAETGLRGASAWRAGCDTVLSVMADRDHTTSNCRNRALVLAKSRTGEEGWRVAFDLSFVELGKDEDGEAFGACYVEPGEAESIITSAKAKPLPRAARAYIDALHIVVDEKGKKVRPFGSEGPEVNAADRDLVRDEFYRAWPADGDDDKARKNAKRQAFGRGEAEAIERHRVAARDVGGVQLVWLLSEPSQ